jgi:hypothetical protein
MRFPLFIVVAIGVLLSSGHLRAQPFEALQHGLDIHAPDGLVVQNADLAEAMLHIPSVDVALIKEKGNVAPAFSSPRRRAWAQADSARALDSCAVACPFSENRFPLFRDML